MTTAAEAVMAVIAGGRGERPTSLRNEETEKVLAIALALLVELSSATDRIDRLEREVAASRGLSLAEWKETSDGDQAQAERAAAVDALQLRVMRILLDPRPSRSDP